MPYNFCIYWEEVRETRKSTFVEVKEIWEKGTAYSGYLIAVLFGRSVGYHFMPKKSGKNVNFPGRL